MLLNGRLNCLGELQFNKKEKSNMDNWEIIRSYWNKVKNLPWVLAEHWLMNSPS